MSLFETGIRPAVDDYLIKKSEEERDYGKYWSASSAGYCKRKVIFDRLKVPKVKQDARKQRIFESGHIFHEWIQRITKDAGLSIVQELELQDEELMVRGHFDDLVLVDKKIVLYDYKTQNSRAFSYQKDRPMSHFHRMQLGTYMYMIRADKTMEQWTGDQGQFDTFIDATQVVEGRILKISKDDLRMSEQQLMWSLELEAEVLAYWGTLNGYWKSKVLPKCTCADREGGFMAREAYNDYFYNEEPCSLEWLAKCSKDGQVNTKGWKAEKES